MKPLKLGLATEANAVLFWKRRELESAQVEIVRVALRKLFVSPADIPESVAPSSRQGVASNAWNVLVAAGILCRVPLAYTNPARSIYGGRVRNTNPSAKGRWVAVYQLASRALAETFLRRAGVPLETVAEPIQEELLV